jgi:hypothetical protein
MKIVISSKQLANDLNKINFKKEYVLEVRSLKGLLVIYTNKQKIKISCEISDPKIIIKQDENRWDWLKLLVNSINEQPIVLELNDYILNIIINY